MKITKVFDGTVPSGGFGQDMTTVFAQRNMGARTGLFVLDFASDPVWTGGKVRMKGRLHPDAPLAFVHDKNGDAIEVDLNTLGAPAWNVAYQGMPLIPEIVWRFNNFQSSNTTTARAWVLE